MAAYTPASINGSPSNWMPAPTLAKIKPTSPRGTIPIPTVSLSTAPPRTPRPDTSLPTIATTVSAPARMSGSVPMPPRSTIIPVRTKKMGAITATMGPMISFRSWADLRPKGRTWTSSRMRPAANAPTMGARPAAPETPASSRQRPMATAANTSCVRSFEASRKTPGIT